MARRNWQRKGSRHPSPLCWEFFSAGELSLLRIQAWQGQGAGLSPSSRGPEKNHHLTFPGLRLSSSAAPGEGSADLFNGDGPATPDAVHLALGGFFLPVQVGALSRLEENRRGVLKGPRVCGVSSPPGIPSQPSRPPSSWAGPSRGAGPGRRDREGTETTSIPTGLFAHTAPYRAAQVAGPGPPLTKEQGHEIPRA